MEMRNNFITKINLRITEFSFFFKKKKKNYETKGIFKTLPNYITYLLSIFSPVNIPICTGQYLWSPVLVMISNFSYKIIFVENH